PWPGGARAGDGGGRAGGRHRPRRPRARPRRGGDPMTVSNDSTATLDHAEEPTSPTGGGAGSTDAAVIAPARSSRKAWVLAIAIAVVVVSAVVMLLLPLKPMVLGGTACVLMLALLFLRMPVALAMLGPSLLGLYALRGEMVVE